MKVKIFPSKCHGTVTIPPSKSMSHRALICASLAAGKSTITNIAYSDDIKITIEGMRNLGATIECFEDYVTVEGINDFHHLKTSTIFCKESGSTLRFFIPIFSLCDQKVTFTGENRLLKRPQKIYEDMFKEQGISYIQDTDKLQIGGALKSGIYEIDGNVSSQFISGLLFTLPLLKEDSIIKISNPYESRSYVDLTLEMLQHYGVQATYLDANTLEVKGNQQYQAQDYRIEGDYSHLGFFAVLAAINNDLDILGLSHDSKQGDKEIIDILQSFHINVQQIKDGYRVQHGPLTASSINLENCPDLGPILNVLMMYADGTSKIYNAERLRYKESDRISAMESELKKCGVSITSDETSITIRGSQQFATNETLSGHKDHRIVMALSVAATLLEHPVIIEEAEYINKSYPTFFEDLQKVSIQVEKIYE